MIESLVQLKEAIKDLKITEPCKLRISIEGEEILNIIGLTCIDDENETICDIHLERRYEDKN
jgi:hypothetical protein